MAGRADEPRDGALFLDELPPLDRRAVLRLAQAAVRARHGPG